MKARLLFFTFLFITASVFAHKKTPKTPLEVVNLIKENVTCEWSAKTVDTFKAGNPESKLTGIAVCMFADMQTLKEALKKGCNFIITHEPVFYNHLDETKFFNNDPVYQEKLKFIEDNNVVVFRYHDHIHKTSPDGIYEGMLNKLDWKKYSVQNSTTKFLIPEMTLEKLAENLKEKLGLESVRVIGKKNSKFTKAGLAVGAPGGSRHINMLQDDDIEVLVAGEAPEWETYLYANDAVNQGRNKAVIFLGHIKSEEAGMDYCTQWLKQFIKEVPIYFIANKPNFTQF